MSNFNLSGLKARNGIDKKALGRGIGSGCGKTCSYGHKGGKARSGRGKVSWFEGGQMPIYRRLPKRGFVSLNDKTGVVCVNLIDLQRLVDNKKIAAGSEVTIDVLKQNGLVRSNASVLRVLAKGKLDVALTVVANYATDAAVRGVESAGGKVQII